MYRKWHRTTSWVIKILIACFFVTACTKTTVYQPLPIPLESISQHVKPGDIVRVATKDKIAWVKITGYVGDEILVGEDLYSGKGFKIPIDKIQEIGRSKDVLTHTEEDTEVTVLTIVLLPLLPFAILGTLVEKPAKEGEKKEHELFSQMSMSEVIDRFGEPIQKYVCGGFANRFWEYEVWEYKEGSMSSMLFVDEDVKYLMFSYFSESPWRGVSEDELDRYRPCEPYKENE